MMEIWIRSIARAGGVEVPATARILEPRGSTSRPPMRGILSLLLRNTAGRLARMARHVDPAPDRVAPCG